MPIDLFRGDLVRLTIEEPQVVAQAFARWNLNSEFVRLSDDDPAHLWSEKRLKERAEMEKDGTHLIEFMVRTLADDEIIGFVGLSWRNPGQGEAFTGLGIGDPLRWGKGFGTDVMHLLLRYAFTELNLRRVSLSVIEYNPRAIRSYQKAGFVEEGRMRCAVHREGQRWDMIYMGILRDEWERISEGIP
jgi:RimJ/RimL family protein N-acetyltransferase